MANDPLAFGKLAVKKGFLNEVDFEEMVRVLEDLRQSGISKTMESLAEERGFMPPDKIEEVVRLVRLNERREADKKYGQAAVQLRLISATQVQEALNDQLEAFQNKQPLKSLADILNTRGLLSVDQHQEILKAIQSGAVRTPMPVAPGAARIPVATPGGARPGTAPAKPLASKVKCPVCSSFNPVTERACRVCGGKLPSRSTDTAHQRALAAAKDLQKNADKEGTRFGELAVEEGMLNEVQVEECVTLQQNMQAKGTRMKIGEILVKRRYLTAPQVQRILSLQQTRRGTLQLEMAAPPDRPADDPPPEMPQISVDELARVHAEAQAEDQPERKFEKLRQFRMFQNTMSAVMSLSVIAIVLVGAGFGLRFVLTGRSGGNQAPPTQTAAEAWKTFEGLDTMENPADISDRIRQCESIVTTYPGTPEADRARKRADELQKLAKRADDGFRETESRAKALAERHAYGEALALWNDYRAAMTRLPGLPHVGDADRALDETTTGARAWFDTEYGKAATALANGDFEAALSQGDTLTALAAKEPFSGFKDSVATLIDNAQKKKAFLEKLRADQARLDADRKKARELAAAHHFCEAQDLLNDLAAGVSSQAIREEIRKEQAEVEKEGIDYWEKEGTRLIADDKLTEGVAAYRKACCVAVSPSHIRRINSIISRMKRDHNEKITSALTRCKTMLMNKAYAKAKEPIDALQGKPQYAEIKNALAALSKKISDCQKDEALWNTTKATWEETERSLQLTFGDKPGSGGGCSTCAARGVVKCPDCNGKKVIQGVCPRCKGNGFEYCKACLGSTQMACPICKEMGTVPFAGGKEMACPKCGGTGSVEAIGGMATCPECMGRARLTPGMPVPCKNCNATGKATCATCNLKGTFPCEACGGQAGGQCRACDGNGGVPCTTCKGSLRSSCCFEGCSCKKCKVKK